MIRFLTDFRSNVPGMLATCSINKTVTLWDTYSQNQPSLVPPAPCGNKSMEVGKLFTLSFYESSPWLLACGGGGNELALWDMTRDDAIQKRFKSRQKDVNTPLNEEDLSSDKAEDFEAMMAVRDDALEKVRENAKKRNNKKKGKKKKGTHKRGR